MFCLKFSLQFFSTHFVASAVEGCQCVAWSRCEFSPEPHAALWCYATGLPICMAHRTAHNSSQFLWISFFKDFDFKIFKALFISSVFLWFLWFLCTHVQWTVASRKKRNLNTSWKPGNVHRFLLDHLDHPCLILVYRSLSWVSILIEPVGWPWISARMSFNCLRHTSNYYLL